MKGRLNNGILLGMQSPTQHMTLAGRNVLFLPQTADVQTMTDSDRHAVITGGGDALVTHQYRARPDDGYR